MKRFLLALFGLGLFAATAATAQDAAQAPAPPKEPEIKREEIIVVSASKTESTIINAPATMSVITPDILATTAAQNYGDLLRSVPGLNVIQTSARDINMTSRASTSTLTNSTLVMLDGRSLYLDFFGLVLWDFVPQSSSEIKQIEVVRGPASAIWGANAFTGVVNIITKTPREAEGFGLNLSGGLFSRSEGSRSGEGNGYTGGGNFSYAKATSEKLSYRLSAGYFYSDPLSRPTGVVGGCAAGVRCVPDPLDSTILTGGATYPADTVAGFRNNGTSQPKADLRVDQELSNGGRITYQGGYAGTKGIVHTGIGPFDIQSGSYLAYGKVNFSKNALKVNVFANFVDAKAPSLLNIDAITLERGITHDLEFERWANAVWRLGAAQGAEVSHRDFRKDLVIELFNEAGQLVLAYKVFRAWVSEYQVLEAKAAGADAVLLIVAALQPHELVIPQHERI